MEPRRVFWTAARLRRRNRASHPPAAEMAQPRADMRQLSSPDAPPRPSCDLFDTTFSLHRVSPLFVGPDPLSEPRLLALGQRLRDTLVGDVVRGVEVGFDASGGGGTAMGNAGALEAVTMAWVAAHDAVATSQPALQVTLQYENALCSALLLPLPQAAAASEPGGSFVHLPLLLLRMPAPLKAAVLDFLASTFDCRIGPLRLSSRDIARSWESWARETALPTKGPLAKDAVLTLALHLPTLRRAAGDDTNSHAASPGAMDAAVPGLRTVDIMVPNSDLRGFLEAGRKLRPDSRTTDGTPLTDALALYLKRHLALDLANPAVAFVRVACGGFVLSESRLKIFDTSESGLDLGFTQHRAAVRLLLGSLAVRASGLA